MERKKTDEDLMNEYKVNGYIPYSYYDENKNKQYLLSVEQAI